MTNSFFNTPEFIVDSLTVDSLDYTPVVIPRVLPRAQLLKQSFNFKAIYNLNVDVMADPKQNPSLVTVHSNESTKLTTLEKSINYYMWTQEYNISDKAENNSPESRWNFATNKGLSHMNLLFDKNIYLGDGVNSGIITNSITEVAPSISTGEDLIIFLDSAVFEVLDAMGKNDDYVLTVVLTGKYAKIYNSNTWNAVSDKTILEMLQTRNYRVTTISNLVVDNQSRIDIVDDASLKLVHGEVPYVHTARGDSKGADFNDLVYRKLRFQSATVAYLDKNPVFSYLETPPLVLSKNGEVAEDEELAKKESFFRKSKKDTSENLE